MANAIAAGSSDLAMVDIMKIGGVTGWMAAMAQAEAAVLPLSNHTFVEPSAHVVTAAPTASWFEYLDIAGAVLTERLLPVDGMVTARGTRARAGLGRARGGALRLLVMGDTRAQKRSETNEPLQLIQLSLIMCRSLKRRSFRRRDAELL